MSKSISKILVIDDILPPTDPLLFKLRMLYKDAILFSSKDDALSYLNEEHLSERNIIILDYKFDGQSYTGTHILEKIRKKSLLIPVILWTATQDNIEDYPVIINEGIFSVVSQNNSELLYEKIAEADRQLNNSIEGAIEEWINIHPENEKNSIFLTSSSGEEYTLLDLLKEIRLQSPVGQKFEKSIVKLTIDRLMRGKEHLNA